MSHHPIARPTDIAGLEPPSSSEPPQPSAAKLTPTVTRTLLTTPLTKCDTGAPPCSGRWHRRLRLNQSTITYCFVFWSFGMCVAFLGPTLLDLGCKTSSVLSTMSWVFFSQSLFILIGSAAGGVILDRFSATGVLFVSTLMLAVTLAIIPLCNVLFLLALVMACMGFFMGTIDTVANVSMIAMYGKGVAPFMQTLHFFYGLGAFVSPMVAEPFLLNEDCSPFINNATGDTGKPFIILNATVPAKTLDEAQAMTHINYAFWTLALFQVPVILLVSSLYAKQLYISFKGKKDTTDLNSQAAAKSKEDYENVEMGPNCGENSALTPTTENDEHPPTAKSHIYLVTLLTALMLFLYDGLQAVYGGFIFSYAVGNIEGMSSTKAAYLNAYFWVGFGHHLHIGCILMRRISPLSLKTDEVERRKGMFAFGRLISIIVATKLRPATMLLGNIVGCMFSMLLMMIWNRNSVAIYVGTCIFGAFLSSVYPTAMSLAEQFIKVTSGITSFIVVGAATGEMLFPVIVGHQFEASPVNFLVFGFVITSISIFVYVGLWITGTVVIQKDVLPGFLGTAMSYLLPQTSTTEGEETGLVNRNVKYYSRMSRTSESSAGEPEDANFGEGIEINHEQYYQENKREDDK